MLKSTIFGLFLAVILITSGYGQQANQPEPSEPGTQVEQDEILGPLAQSILLALEAIAENADSKKEKLIAAELSDYYAANDYHAVWIVNGRASKKAKRALDVLNMASDHGLDPNDYDVEALYQEMGTSSLNPGDFEVRISSAIVTYSRDLNAGRVNPQSINRENVVFPKALSVAAIMGKITTTQNIEVMLRFMAPHTPRYDRLRQALADYRLIKKNGGWNTISEGEVLKPGMSDARINEVRIRMIQDGTLSSELATGELYDEPVVMAVKQFQSRHGLEPDGVIGPQTLEELNTTVDQRINTMIINLERRRWMQNNYGRVYVFANLADQVIKLVRDGKTVHAELIQVGKPYHRTPVFKDEMEYVELNPYWNVPYSIATKEYLPKLKSNPGVLVRQNIKVLAGGKIVSPYSVPWNSYSRRNFPVRLRQDSGKKNALGRVKFMFPNKFNVYIHDTPAKSKFNKSSRYFSHGCLRLRDPLTMAEQILKPLGWNRKKIDKIVASGKRTIVKLKQKIPVHVTYLTSWVNKDGSVQFRRDVYGRDTILSNALGLSS